MGRVSETENQSLEARTPSRMIMLIVLVFGVRDEDEDAMIVDD